MRRWKWKAFRPLELAEALNNPWRGFYQIHRFRAEDPSVPEVWLSPEQSLCLVEINLAHFASEPLPPEALARVEEIFACFQQHRREMIVRFLYDWDGDGLRHEPLHIGTVLGHIRQLKPAMLRYERAIYLHQGLFVGSWGEMHTSRHLSEEAVTELAHALYESTGGHTFLALRCPHYWRQLFRTYDPCGGGEMGRRFGLYNDAILGSSTDLGTYGEIPQTASRTYGDKLSRAEELEFQSELCLRVPNGGEAVGEGAKDVSALVKTLKRMRVSYLNSDHDPAAVNHWRTTRCGTGGAIWRNRSAYAYLAAHLGYRFMLVRASVARNRGGHEARISLRNRGFSGCYHAFEVSLIVRGEGGVERVYLIPTDTREWQPGVKISLSVHFEGTGTLALRIFDPMSGKAIRLGNLPMDESGAHVLGKLR